MTGGLFRLYMQHRRVGFPADQAHKLARAALAINTRGVGLGR